MHTVEIPKRKRQTSGRYGEPDAFKNVTYNGVHPEKSNSRCKRSKDFFIERTKIVYFN